MEFLQAKNYGPALPAAPDPKARRIDLIVVHTMEAPEKPHTARAVAKWFAGDSAPMASAHVCIDDQEAIACVREQDVAWAAPGANRNGFHIEHAGYAAQNAAQWDDVYSRAVLARSAQITAGVCWRWQIPIAHVTPGPGVRGLCGHVDVTNALNGGHGHTDPGGAFPWDKYLSLVRDEILKLYPIT